MKKHCGLLSVIGNEGGFFVLVAVTVVLTTLIGGVAIVSIVATRQPLSGAMERLASNEATPQDMDALQNAGDDTVRTARIAAGAGSFVGGGGPVPNPAAPVGAGSIFPGDKAVAGIIPRVISRVTNRASQPAQTGDNPLPPSVSGGEPMGTDSSGYDPSRDPGMGSGSGQSVDPNIGSAFQGQVPGGGSRPPSDGGMGGQPIAQPPEYTSPTGPPGDTADGTTGPYVTGPAGYCPEGYYPGPDNRCRPAPPCPHNWVIGHDGICHPAGGLLPPPRPGDGHTGGGSQPGTKTGGTSSGGGSQPGIKPGGGSQPGTGGPCPPGCHLKPDGSGQCHCGGN